MVDRRPLQRDMSSEQYASCELPKNRSKDRATRRALLAARQCLAAVQGLVGVAPVVGTQVQSIIGIAVAIISRIEVSEKS